jgi:hypothetical protein
MKKSPILSLIVLIFCGSGGSCVATPNTTMAQSFPSNRVVAPKPATFGTPRILNSGSSFVPGVTLPVFPGTMPIPVASGAAAQPLLSFPLVEVPTPGLAAATNKRLSPRLSTGRRRIR